MNTSKHTPGPWTKGTSNEGKECVWLNGLTEPFYGMGPDHTWIDCGTEANANLVAAAPDLLAVLQELQESASYWSEYDVPLGIVDRINSAITKAKGEQV